MSGKLSPGASASVASRALLTVLSAAIEAAESSETFNTWTASWEPALDTSCINASQYENKNSVEEHCLLESDVELMLVV